MKKKDGCNCTFWMGLVILLLFSMTVLAYVLGGVNKQRQTVRETPFTYTCPETEYVDCMPGPGQVKSQCDEDFLKWAESNCPNFKGASY